MANYMNSQKKRGPKQRDLSLDGLNYVDLGSSKVCVSLPLKLMIGWTDGTSLEAPRLELGRAFVGRMMVTLYQVRSFIVSLKKERRPATMDHCLLRNWNGCAIPFEITRCIMTLF